MSFSRRVAALIALAAAGAPISGCGGAEPHYRQRTAAEWAADVWSPNAADAARAFAALKVFSVTHAGLVTDALGAQLTRPRPGPSATPFSIRLYLAAARRLGLEPLPASEALEVDLTLLNRRIAASGIVLGSLHGDAKGNVDVILDGGRSRAEAERVQRHVCRRGALDLRAILIRPAADSADAAEFASWFEAERLRFEESEKSGTAYGPARADRRVARAAPAAPGEGAVELLALDEPVRPEDVFDERMVESARGVVERSGRGLVRLTVLPGRRDDFAKWTGALVGREIAVMRDGVVTERFRVGKALRDRFEVAAVGELGAPPDEARRAREDAAVISTGRLPRPLEPVPLPEGFGADPAPRNPLSQLMLELGSVSIPALERVVNDASAPAWSRKSAQWALAEIRTFEAQRDGK